MSPYECKLAKTSGRLRLVFPDALKRQITRHGDTVAALSRLPNAPKATTLTMWMSGAYLPKNRASLEFLNALEARYGLRRDYFGDRIQHIRRGRRKVAEALPDNDLRPYLTIRSDILRWHLPEDFAERPKEERERIEAWLARTFVNPESRYIRYLKEGLQTAGGFDLARRTDFTGIPLHHDLLLSSGLPRTRSPRRPMTNTRPSPSALADAWNALVRFKTSPMTPEFYQRDTIWSASTVKQRATVMGTFFGILAATPSTRRGGLRVPIPCLTFALLLVPAVMDAYLQVKQKDRGFLSRPESALLELVQSLARPNTGWLRQSPWLAKELRPIDGLVTLAQIAWAKRDWSGFCDGFCNYAATRGRDVRRLVQESRSALEPIEVVLASPSPLSTYRRIADEVLRHVPDRNEKPVEAAKAVQTYLMLRIAMHTGLRQKNLRQLVFRTKGQKPTPEAELATLRRGELRWIEASEQWQVMLPSAAFKNSTSSFFRNGCHIIALPDAADLYVYLDRHLAEGRTLLVGDRAEPGTFFVRDIKRGPAEHDAHSFYGAWRTAIQIYGIYNPWTGRGAIEGLLPHGPHCVRAVLATHVLKLTGSFEYAGFAIQDLAETVEASYARFLPSEKSDLVARFLSPVWEDYPSGD